MPAQRPVWAACHRLRLPAAISWSARLAWLAGIAALVAVPASTSAATPAGTTGGSGDIPAPSLLDQACLSTGGTFSG